MLPAPRPLVAAYVYPGWHPCPERDRHFPEGWREWDLVYGARPLFAGHRQPNLPADGPYDDSRPETAQRQIELARAYGVDAFVYGLFWSRGKRVFGAALDQGFLGGAADFPFAVMWANRMPRRVLPVKQPRAPVIDPTRLVHTDPEDFLDLVRYLAEAYFHRPSYLRRAGAPYLSIFDTTFFLRQLGVEAATTAVAAAKDFLRRQGLGGLHLVAIDPAPAFWPLLGAIGFDAVTFYVRLPEWKGAELQDYRACGERCLGEWAAVRAGVRLPFSPSVSPGWDATPRASDFGPKRPKRYPWSPIVTGSDPDAFAWLLGAAAADVTTAEASPMVMLASWNEWSEGHYLEPDQRFGDGWLQAVRRVFGCVVIDPRWHLFTVDVELTNRCACACAMCPRQTFSRPVGSMSLAVAEAVAATLAPQTAQVTFSGLGDPLLHPDLGQCVRLFVQHDLATGIQVSVAALGPAAIDRLVAAGPRFVNLSVPSVRPEVLGRLVPGRSPDALLAAAAALVEACRKRITLTVVGVATRLDPDGEAFIAHWRDLGVHARVFPCHSRGGGLADPSLLDPDRPRGVVEPCGLLARHGFVTWEGDLLACCHDRSGETRLGSLVGDGAGAAALARKNRVAECVPAFELCRTCDEPLRLLPLPAGAPPQSARARRRALGRLGG